MSLRTIGSLVEYLLRRGRRRQIDHQVAEEFAWHQALALPDGLEIEWLGTSGFALDYRGHRLLIDPYISRVPLSAVLARRIVAPQPALLDQWLGAARVAEPDEQPADKTAVLIGHSHFDHALDAPLISERTGARVYGSRSSARLMALYGLERASVVVEPYKVYDIGPFAVTFVPSAHSKLVLGLTIPYQGDISCEHFDELTPAAYRCGDVYGIRIQVAGVTLYHQGSAELVDDALERQEIDILLAGISGRAFSRDYMARILGKLEPRVVVPHHFDDFFRPLDEPMEFSFNVNLAGFVEEVAAVSRDFQVAVPRRVAAPAL